MAEFFEDSQRAHFGRVVRPADRRPLLCIVDPNDIVRGRYRYFEGIYPDGWIRRRVRFRIAVPRASRAVALELRVPRDPRDAGWRLSGEAVVDAVGDRQPFSLAPGTNELVVDLPEPVGDEPRTVELDFGPGFTDPENPDTREFRARLLGMKVTGDR
jgi:hypothetical protein